MWSFVMKCFGAVSISMLGFAVEHAQASFGKCKPQCTTQSTYVTECGSSSVFVRRGLFGRGEWVTTAPQWSTTETKVFASSTETRNKKAGTELMSLANQLFKKAKTDEDKAYAKTLWNLGDALGGDSSKEPAPQ